MSQLSAMYDEARRLAVEVRITLDKIESSEASARLGMGVAGMSAHGWGPHTADTGLRRTAHGASTSAGVDGMAQEARAKLEALSKISAEMERSWRQQVRLAGECRATMHGGESSREHLVQSRVHVCLWSVLCYGGQSFAMLSAL